MKDTKNAKKTALTVETYEVVTPEIGSFPVRDYATSENPFGSQVDYDYSKDPNASKVTGNEGAGEGRPGGRAKK